MYNESEGLGLFFSRVVPILDSVTQDWEIICINDGSKDDTLSLLIVYHHADARIKIIDFSRNFGKEAALCAGLTHARGQAVIPIDADLQDPPELIPEMVEKWREGFKVVAAARRSRASDSWFKRNSARAFYRLLNAFTGGSIPENVGDFRLMDAQVVDVLRALPERTRFMKGLFAWPGFSTTIVHFDRAPRAAGESKLSLYRIWSLAKDGIFSFTTLPLSVMTFLGAFFSLFAFIYAIKLIGQYIFLGRDVPGYLSIMLSVLGMGGIQLLCLGILGEYLGRIYHEAKGRPLYVVQKNYGL